MNRSTLFRRAPNLIGTVAVAVSLAACGGASDEASGTGATALTSPAEVTTEPSVDSTAIVAATMPAATTIPAATTTEYVNPFSDQEIASRLLLEVEEYAPGWQRLEEWRAHAFDEDVAATIPSCAPFVDTVFTRDQPPTAVDWRWFHTPPGMFGAMSQLVFVFPSDEAAEAFFHASTDPAFTGECLDAYLGVLGARGDLSCCDPNQPFLGAFGGQPMPTVDTLHSDDIAFRDFDEYWTDGSGTTHGPDQLRLATVRAGRTVAVIETLLTDGSGVVVNTEEQFQHTIGAYIDRARHTLGGVDHVLIPATTSTATTTTTLAPS